MKLDKILIIILFLLIAVAGFTLVLYKSQAGECLVDPLGYAQKQTKIESAYCSCVAIQGDKRYIFEAKPDYKLNITGA